MFVERGEEGEMVLLLFPVLVLDMFELIFLCSMVIDAEFKASMFSQDGLMLLLIREGFGFRGKSPRNRRHIIFEVNLELGYYE